MANGGYKAINEIGPGDFVMAHDLETGEWRAQEVLDQWSHLDDGHMASVTINDGSEVTATDHHLFWVDNDQAWVELDQVEPGDELLTPNGTVEVLRCCGYAGSGRVGVGTHRRQRPQFHRSHWHLRPAGSQRTVHPWDART